jgi:hypothetical protein
MDGTTRAPSETPPNWTEDRQTHIKENADIARYAAKELEGIKISTTSTAEELINFKNSFQRLSRLSGWSETKEHAAIVLYMDAHFGHIADNLNNIQSVWDKIEMLPQMIGADMAALTSMRNMRGLSVIETTKRFQTTIRHLKDKSSESRIIELNYLFLAALPANISIEVEKLNAYRGSKFSPMDVLFEDTLRLAALQPAPPPRRWTSSEPKHWNNTRVNAVVAVDNVPVPEHFKKVAGMTDEMRIWFTLHSGCKYCREKDHQVENCKKRNFGNYPVPTTLSNRQPLTPITTVWAPSQANFTFNAWINGNPCSVLIDTGCSGMVVSRNLVKKWTLPTFEVPGRSVIFANNSSTICNLGVTATITISSYTNQISMAVCEINEDIIFGIPFLQSIQITHLDWHNSIFKFSAEGTHHTLISNGRNNIMCSIRHLQDIDHPIDDQLTPIDDMEDAIQFHDQLGWYKQPSIQKIVGPPDLTGFLSSQLPEISKILKPYIQNVFTDIPHFRDIPTRREDMAIMDKPEAITPPKSRPLKRLSVGEEQVLNAKLDELLASGFITPSQSSYGSAVIFATKPDGSLRLCIDYRGVNLTTVRDLTPLPSHIDLRDKVQGSNFLSKIDIRDAFHMLRIKARGHPQNCI